MKKNQKLIPVAILLLIGFASCSMKQEIYISEDGSGTVNVEIGLADYLTEVVSQVQTAVDPENPRPEGTPFFNTEEISADFAKRDGVELNSIESPTENSLVGSFSFDDVNALYQKIEADSAESRLITLTEKDGISEFKVNFTRETFEALLAENPSMNNPLVVSFGPSSNRGLSEEDYLGMMEFALGSESRQGIVDSSLSLKVTVEGTIIEQQGGRLLGGNSVLFEIPLLPVLLLSEPLEYSLRYQ